MVMTNIQTGKNHFEPENLEFKDGIALSLSGGGYRAMLFHTGAIWRLNEAGLLLKINLVSSVSGGSITAAVLALAWNALSFNNNVASNFVEKVVAPIRTMASHTIDVSSVLEGVLLPGSVSHEVAKSYDQVLFNGKTLQDLSSLGPEFIFNATNIGTGVLWKFSKDFMGDYRIGEFLQPKVAISDVVACSSAFPPFLSPHQIKLDSSQARPASISDLSIPPYNNQAFLSDGGVYDNLGLEDPWKRFKTLLVSDGGQKMNPDPKPATDWALHAKRVLDVIDSQVRSLRVRWLIDAYNGGLRTGAYWGIQSDISHYGLQNALQCPFSNTHTLAETPTRLKALDPTTQDKLINWGYAICDAAIRRHVDGTVKAPNAFPYPGSMV